MEPAVVGLISALTSILVALVGAYVARRKGLPTINAEIEVRNAELIVTLKDQVAALRLDLDDARRDTAEAQDKLKRAVAENEDLKRRVSLAEGDLLTLYRETGRRPPPRLSRGGNRG